MYIKQLSLEHYRNYDTLNLTFSPSINIFLGQNAQGKTNLLESIYVLALTNSHRTNHAHELVQFGEETARIRGDIVKKTTELPLEVAIHTKGKMKGKTVKVNHLLQQRLSQYFGQMNVVLFSPEDLDLIKGAPAHRRHFFDTEIGQMHPKYLHMMIEYRRFMQQRNAYLKQDHIDATYLDILDESLAERGAYLMLERKRFLAHLEKIAANIHQHLSLGKETMTLQYDSSFPFDTDDEAELKALFIQQLARKRDYDILNKKTSVGLQREDFTVFINQLKTQQYGSQGQQRLAVLSLKLAEVQLFYEQSGEYPILLLDDVMSELDNHRQMKLMETIEGKVQTFITTTTLSHLQNQMSVTPTIFRVQQGQIEEIIDENETK